MPQDFPQTTDRRLHSRIAHTRSLKDNARLAWKYKEQQNKSLPMKLEQLLRVAAVNEHRSIANMIAVMIRDYCGRVRVEIQEQSTLPVESERKSTPRKR